MIPPLEAGPAARERTERAAAAWAASIIHWNQPERSKEMKQDCQHCEHEAHEGQCVRAIGISRCPCGDPHADYAAWKYSGWGMGE